MSDLISRQAAIDAVDEALTRVFVEHRDIAEKMINKIPSAQPERNKGLWHWADGMYSCDQCGEMLDEKSPFCPMCGADMRGEQDEVD